NAAGTIVGSFQAKVYLASSGTEQSFAFSINGLSSGRYTVPVVLGPESRPVDARTVVVTVRVVEAILKGRGAMQRAVDGEPREAHAVLGVRLRRRIGHHLPIEASVS